MDATILLLCLSLGQTGTPYDVTPPDAPSEFVPTAPPRLGEPTPAEGPPPTGLQREPRQFAAPPPQAESSQSTPAASPQPASFSLRDVSPEEATAPPGDDRVVQDETAPRGRNEYVGEREQEGSDAADIVVQANAEQPLATQELAESLLTYALQPRDKSPQGEPLTLRSTIEKLDDRASTVRAVKAYWQLSLAIADHHHAVEEVGFLSSLPSPAPAHQQAKSVSALSAARARQVEAELALAAAQQDLTEAARSTDAGPVIPADSPFVGKYRTNFEALFASRPVPAGLRRINRTLPILHRLITARADAVAAAGEELKAMTQAYQGGDAGFDDLHASFIQLRGQRIAFLAAVRDYNYSIADYALSVSTPQLDRDAIVSMLIETKNEDRSVLAPGGSTDSPAKGSSSTAAPPLGRPPAKSSVVAPATRQPPRFLGGQREPLPPTTGTPSAAGGSPQNSGGTEFVPSGARATSDAAGSSPPSSAQQPAAGRFVPLRQR
jgi:hypothetical protein